MLRHTLPLALLALAACAQPAESADPAPAAAIEEPEAGLSAEDRAAAVAAADAWRADVEGRLDALHRVEVATDGLRPQVRQKWATLHYYFDGEDLLRVKSYPHEGVSARTEEFYFRDGNLVLAVIEDDGSAAVDAEAEDKRYYFLDGAVIQEFAASGETEYAIRDSDGERLLQEAAEYRDLAPEAPAAP